MASFQGKKRNGFPVMDFFLSLTVTVDPFTHEGNIDLTFNLHAVVWFKTTMANLLARSTFLFVPASFTLWHEA